MNLIKHTYKGLIYNPELKIDKDGQNIIHNIYSKYNSYEPTYIYHGSRIDYMTKKQFIDYINLMEKLTDNGR
jgi:hypothetical protein